MAKRRFSKRQRAGTDQYWTRFRDSEGRRRYLQADSEERLIEKLAEAQKQVRSAPAITGDRDVTLEAYAGPWLKRVASDLKFATATTYRIIYQNHLAPTLGQLKLRDLSRQDVRRLLDSKRDGGLAKATLRLISAVLSGILAEALEDGIVTNNSAHSVGRRKRSHTSSEIEAQSAIRPFTKSQIAELLAGARDLDDRTFLTLLARTGLRPGEATALRWSDLDFSAREVLVERAFYRGHLGTPKTGRRRKVDMALDLAKALTTLYTQREREKLQRLRDIADWVFVDRNNEPISHNLVTTIFSRAMRRSKLSGHTTYDLRHTFATQLLADGVPVTYVSKQMGHAGPQVTLRYYAHWIPNASDKRFVDALAPNLEELVPNLAETHVQSREFEDSSLTIP